MKANHLKRITKLSVGKQSTEMQKTWKSAINFGCFSILNFQREAHHSSFNLKLSKKTLEITRIKLSVRNCIITQLTSLHQSDIIFTTSVIDHLKLKDPFVAQRVDPSSIMHLRENVNWEVVEYISPKIMQSGLTITAASCK